jgi:hypothetical protein
MIVDRNTKMEQMLEKSDMNSVTSSSDESSPKSSPVNSKSNFGLLDSRNSSIRRSAVKPLPIKKKAVARCHMCQTGFYNDEYVEYMFCINCRNATCIRCNTEDIRCEICNKKHYKIHNMNDLNYIEIKSNKRYCFWFC